MHKILERQLRRAGLSVDVPPEDPEAWSAFLGWVDGFYQGSDRSRYLLERSLRHSSDELLEANRALATSAEREIAEREARYRDLFRLSQIATWEENFEGAAEALDELRASGVTDLAAHLTERFDVLVDVATRVEVVDANPAVAQLLRIEDTDSIIGQMRPPMVKKESAPVWIAQLEAIWNARGSVHIDHMIGTRHDGERFHAVLDWHAPQMGDRFDYSRVVVNMVDITDRVEAEERMKRILASKDEFLASVSHELRTPLTSVVGFAQVLRETCDDIPENERDALLEIIAAQSSDLSDIVEDLLVAARAELGQLTVGSEPVDLKAEISQALESGQASEKHFEVNLPEHTVTAVGDPQRIRQILRNLLTNAERYGGPNVRVTLDTSPTEAFVSVLDDGAGVDRDAAQRLFERYYRSQQDEGLTGSVGIGLTIARDLARLMNGDVTYERRNGFTAFTLRLPALVAADAVVEPRLGRARAYI